MRQAVIRYQKKADDGRKTKSASKLKVSQIIQPAVVFTEIMIVLWWSEIIYLFILFKQNSFQKALLCTIYLGVD